MPRSCWRNDATGIGYLLKDRVADVSQFVEALERVASGGNGAGSRSRHPAHGGLPGAETRCLC